MHLASVADWLAWGALALSLAVLAWSAREYILVKKNEQRQRDFENFFIIIQRANNADKSMIAQLSAIFELRNYPQYKDVVIRIADDSTNTFGVSEHHAVVREFRLTAEYLRNL